MGKVLSRLSLMLVLVSACGDSGQGVLDVAVSFVDGAPRSDDSVRVEVYLVENCGEVVLGSKPDSPLASTFTLRDGREGPDVGAIDPGEYGLYARAQDEFCAVVGAGCTATVIDSGTTGPLSVTMAGFSGAPCLAGQECVVETGECVPGPCFEQPDETPCAEDGATGQCRSSVCCTGCWDGGQCLPGTHTQQCGSGGAECSFVPGCPF